MASNAANTWGAIAGGTITPTATPQTLTSNYIDFTSDTTKGWAQQYLPDLMEQEAEIFGNRTIGGFLEMVGAEEPMTSDQVVWSEQSRLHLAYKGNHDVTANTGTAAAKLVFTVTKDIDGVSMDGVSTGIRVGDLVVVADSDKTIKGYVKSLARLQSVGSPAKFFDQITIEPLKQSVANLTDTTADDSSASTIFVYGSEYGKGTAGRTEGLQQSFKSLTNKPMIMKDMYEINGSDVSQIGWVEISGEAGQSGYLWYLKAAADTRQRFTDYVEMTMIEHELTVDVDTQTAGTQTMSGHAALSSGYNALTTGGNITGTEGLFAAIEARGNVFNGLLGTAQGPTSHAANFKLDIDEVLKEFDKQGAIEEYMVFGNRDLMLGFDDFLAAQNSYGGGGTSYGVFDNSEDMALNLGFSGFRRGSYDFYKSDWKYLNDQSTRGGIADVSNHIRGVFVPAGVTSVYDQTLGKNLKRPFLHVRYRASQMDDRRFKTWTTGSVGAATSDLDAMQMHFLSERCLITQGANNFMLLKGLATYS